MLKRRIKYLVRSISNIYQEKKCPYCDGTNLKLMDKKYMVTSLFKCNTCCLNFRHPTDSEKWLKKFDQQEYSMDTHRMTYLPSDAEIKNLKQENFASLRSYDSYIEAIFGSKEVKIIDYGCSWGYNVFKLKNAGYKAVGYELSKHRAVLGTEKLGIEIFSTLEELPANNDLILSSHVIEHLVDIDGFIKFSKAHLTKKGVFMAFCPNGNNAYRNREPEIWHSSWGDMHANLIDVEFAKYIFKSNPYLILTGDAVFNTKEIKGWDGLSQKTGCKQDGEELLIISKPNITL